MARVKGSKNKRTLLREAELEAIRAGTKKDVLMSIYVMEHIMEYFFFRAKGMRAVGNHDKAERYYLRALTAAEKIAPYKYARLSAVKVMGDPNAQKDFEDGATLEELKAMVEYHPERVAPFLDLEVKGADGLDLREPLSACLPRFSSFGAANHGWDGTEQATPR
jgi:hypothetical protein